MHVDVQNKYFSCGNSRYRWKRRDALNDDGGITDLDTSSGQMCNMGPDTLSPHSVRIIIGECQSCITTAACIILFYVQESLVAPGTLIEKEDK